MLMPGCTWNRQEDKGEDILSDASLISYYERDGYDEVVIRNASGHEMARYILVDRSAADTPEIPDGAVEVRVPLRSIVTDSEVYSSALEELGADNKLTGMFDTSFVTSQKLKSNIDSGKILSLGSISNPNLEKVMDLSPDAILISYFDGMQASNLDQLGIPVIKMHDLQESTPLGRAEWIRFIGRLTGDGDMADKIYSEVKTNYQKATMPKENNAKPKVLTDLMYEGIWYVPGGNSYQAKLIADAGGDYFMNGNSTPVTLNLSAEQVLEQGSDADIWIIRHFGNASGLRSIIESDPVYKQFKAFKNGNIYFSDTSESGLFREFPFHPERLLDDYRIIFSGDTGAEPRYFKRLSLE